MEWNEWDSKKEFRNSFALSLLVSLSLLFGVVGNSGNEWMNEKKPQKRKRKLHWLWWWWWWWNQIDIVLMETITVVFVVVGDDD